MPPSKRAGDGGGAAVAAAGSVPFSYVRGKPLDLSFKGLESLERDAPAGVTAPFALGFVNSSRTLGLPVRRGGYVTASVLLANNRLTGGLDGLVPLMRRALHRPDALCWLDVSKNRLSRVPDGLAEFPNLRTLYAHHNDVADLWAAVRALRRLPRLRSLTLQNNPLAQVPGYRAAVVHMVPQLTSLDFVRVTEDERRALPPTWVKRYADVRVRAAAVEATAVAEVAKKAATAAADLHNDDELL